MNRIKNLFKKDKDKLIVFLTAGYPEINSTEKLVLTAVESGADMIEIGIPFSDPQADGPIIQKASEKALSNGITLDIIFQQVKSIRKKTNIPISLMGYYNPILKRGIDRFLADCVVNEIDGIILSLLSSIFVSGGIITVSYLTKKETTMNILIFHSAISSILTFLIFFDGISFHIQESFFSLFLLTITALTAQYFNVESYRNEKASSIILIGYTRIIFSTILGFLFLEEKISFLALFGILVIILTTFFVQKPQLKKS